MLKIKLFSVTISEYLPANLYVCLLFKSTYIAITTCSKKLLVSHSLSKRKPVLADFFFSLLYEFELQYFLFYRLGVDANGYDDTSVENLRGRLSAFLCRSASSNMALPIQIATVTALLGVISLSFEELIKSSTELPEVVSYSSPDDCVRKWFSLLSNEQQSLSMRLLIAGVPSCGTG